jgi:hypothetical protein
MKFDTIYIGTRDEIEEMILSIITTSYSGMTLESQLDFIARQPNRMGVVHMQTHKFYIKIL